MLKPVSAFCMNNTAPIIYCSPIHAARFSQDLRAICDHDVIVVMSIFNRFFDYRLNWLSENRVFFDFLKFDFDRSIILKSKNWSFCPIEATACSIFCFFNMGWNYGQSKKYIYFFTVLEILHRVKKLKNRTGVGLLAVKIYFWIVNFFYHLLSIRSIFVLSLDLN